MSASQSNPPGAACPPTVNELQTQLHQRLDEIIAYCWNDQSPASFLEFETALLGLLRSLGGLLIQLFLRARHERLDPRHLGDGDRVSPKSLAGHGVTSGEVG